MQKERIQEETVQTAAAKRSGRQRRSLRQSMILLAVLMLLAASGLLLLKYGPSLYAPAQSVSLLVPSGYDRDGDRIDDYADIMLAARQYIQTEPEYDDSYFAGGYPPDGRGVCTDVIWRALAAAGYDFKALVDADILAHQKEYPLANGLLDANIDFRRVVNLQVWFERNGIPLTTDPGQTNQWQPGDFVFYAGHVAIVSDRRNESGQPWIIHHTGHGAFEEDALTYKPIIGHYRWNPEPFN